MMNGEGSLDPSQITDPIKHHTKMRPYVYFEEMATKLIKIGYVGDLENGIKRRAGYGLYGGTLLAVLPGRDIEERELKRTFKQDLAIGREQFHPTDRILGYIERLLERGFAAPSYELAEYLGAVDYALWKPDSPSLANAVNTDAQTSFFALLPVRERIAMHGVHFTGSSKSDDWYTPKKWVDLAREVMGGIDLDPASTKQANDECVGATYWYTKELNGLDLTRQWRGRIWLNPPYGAGANSAQMFITRLRREVTAGNVQQAVTCLNVNTMGNKWFASELALVASAHCIPSERISFISPASADCGSGSPTNGTVFTYVGPHVERFGDVYRPYGQVLSPIRKAA